MKNEKRYLRVNIVRNQGIAYSYNNNIGEKKNMLLRVNHCKFSITSLLEFCKSNLEHV